MVFSKKKNEKIKKTKKDKEESKTEIKELKKKRKFFKRKTQNHFSSKEKDAKIESETKNKEKEHSNVHNLQGSKVHVKNDQYSTMRNKKQQIYGKKSKTSRNKIVKKQNQHLILSPELEKQKNKTYVFDKSSLKELEKNNNRKNTLNKEEKNNISSKGIKNIENIEINENIESSWKKIDLVQDDIKEFSLSKKEKKIKKKSDKKTKKIEKKLAKQQAKETKKLAKINKKSNKKKAKKSKTNQNKVYKKDTKLSIGARLMVGILILAMFIGMLAPATSFIII